MKGVRGVSYMEDSYRKSGKNWWKLCTLITLTLHSPFAIGMHNNELAIWNLNIPWFPRTHIWLQLDWDHIKLLSVLLTTFRTKSISPISALTSEVKESFFKVHFTLSTTTHNKTSTKAILLSLKQVNYLARLKSTKYKFAFSRSKLTNANITKYFGLTKKWKQWATYIPSKKALTLAGPFPPTALRLRSVLVCCVLTVCGSRITRNLPIAANIWVEIGMNLPPSSFKFT